MDFKNYTHEDKLAVIAVIKGIIMAHQGIEDGEIENLTNYINNNISDDNFPDYKEIFNEFDKKYTTESTINEAFAEVNDSKIKEDLIELGLNLAASSGVIEPTEIEVINHMCEIWGLEHKIAPQENDDNDDNK